jgi:uncharacterized protein YbaA (DUF1428 family)
MLCFSSIVCQKKNHEALVQLGKQANEMFKKVGVIRSEVFQLSNTQDMMGFTNISKTVSAKNDEEEVVLETQTYRDQKHYLKWVQSWKKIKMQVCFTNSL